MANRKKSGKKQELILTQEKESDGGYYEISILIMLVVQKNLFLTGRKRTSMYVCM